MRALGAFMRFGGRAEDLVRYVPQTVVRRGQRGGPEIAAPAAVGLPRRGSRSVRLCGVALDLEGRLEVDRVRHARHGDVRDAVAEPVADPGDLGLAFVPPDREVVLEDTLIAVLLAAGS